MPKKPDKMAVLQAIKEAASNISLPELLNILGEGFAERSVRRWIQALIKDNLIEKSGQKRSTRYQLRANSSHLKFSTAGNAAMHHAAKPLYERDPVAYHSDWLSAYIPNQTYYLPIEKRNQLRSAGARESGIAGTFAHQIYNRLLIDLSYNSSRLEGNTYSLLDTEKLLLKNLQKSGTLDEERIMIINHKDAIRYLVDKAPQLRIEPHTIYTLHYLLSDGLIDVGYAGRLRDHSVRISGSTYIPLDNPIHLDSRLTQLCEMALKINDPIEQSFFLLTHISYLQAFSDVNKRTARLSANIPFIIHNFAPLSFNDIEKDDYALAMIAIYEKNDTSALADLFEFSYLRSTKSYDVNAIAIGHDETRVRYRKERRELVSTLIKENTNPAASKKIIIEFTETKIPTKLQDDFIRTIYEDLEHINPHRIAGLQVTQAELERWLKKAK